APRPVLPGAHRLRRRGVRARLGDRRRPAHGAVLRRLDDHLGQHDRHGPRGAVGRLRDRRAAGRPRRQPAGPGEDRPRGRRAPGRRAVRVGAVPAHVGGGAGRRERRGVRGLAARGLPAHRRPGPAPGRRLALRPAAQRPLRGVLRADLGPPVGHLHPRLALRDVPLRARARAVPGGEADLPRLRRGPRPRGARGPAVAPRGARPGRPRAAPARPDGHREGHGGPRGGVGGRDGVPVRARAGVRGRHAAARAQRGPGDPLPHAPRHRPDRGLLGRVPRDAARRAGAGAAVRGDPRQRGRHRGPRVRGVLPRHGRRHRGARRGAQRGRAGLVRPRAAARAADVRAGRPPVAAHGGPPLRRDLRRRLPPAVHPLLPGHPRVLRARPREAEPGRRRARERRVPRGQPGPRAGPHRHDARRLPDRPARPERAHEHRGPRDGGRGGRGPPARRGRLPARGAAPARGRHRGAAGARAARRARLHGRRRARGVAHRRLHRRGGRVGRAV
ncbi:MAG: Spermidine synthase, partial [uncultured Solirubrobacteraceae bacterium]